MATDKSFPDAEAKRVQHSPSCFGVCPCNGVRLPDELREQTLHPCGRDSALRFFNANGIRWWTYTDERGDRPTSLLRSSQVACVNHLEPGRLNERLAIALGRQSESNGR
jgi:hypothetical protein